MQQGDVKLFQTIDSGDIEVSNGIVTMSSGMDTSAYLSLFGGNEQDDGRDGNRSQWWGNAGETDTFRSETQYLLRSIPATTGNLLRVQDAAARDLKWMIDSGVAKSISITVSMPGLNMVKLVINIDGIPIEFVNSWGA